MILVCCRRPCRFASGSAGPQRRRLRLHLVQQRRWSRRQPPPPPLCSSHFDQQQQETSRSFFPAAEDPMLLSASLRPLATAPA